MENIAYLINNVEEYGKFISFCIDKDINVFRTYWDEREKGNRCFIIHWDDRRCCYATRDYLVKNGFEIVVPEFYISYGSYKIR